MADGVHITKIRAHEVVVPTFDGANNSPSMGGYLNLKSDGVRIYDWDEMPIVMLEFEFSDGIIGLGEVGRGHSLTSISHWVAQLPGLPVHGTSLDLLPPTFRPELMLQEAFPTAHWTTISPVTPAVEMALFDHAGKRLGCRMADLLGGVHREQVPVDYWCGRQTPADLERKIAIACERGFTGIKMKSRLGDPVIDQVKSIRKVGGENFSVTIDPMTQWFSPHDGLHILKSLEQFGGNIRVEDPFPHDRPEFWLRAKQVCSVPLIWHSRELESLRSALAHGCADNYNCAGGAAEFMTYAHAVEIAGYSCWRGSALEMGVAQVAGLHAAAAARSCTMASDFQSAIVRKSTLIDWDWPYKDGFLPLPMGDGLGVHLDMKQVEHYRTNYAEFTCES